jgi:hypothetical protein
MGHVAFRCPCTAPLVALTHVYRARNAFSERERERERKSEQEGEVIVPSRIFHAKKSVLVLSRRPLYAGSLT